MRHPSAERVSRIALVTAGLSVTGGIVVIGAILGEFLNPLYSHTRTVPGVILGAFVGFLAAGVGLRIATHRGSTSKQQA